MVITDTRIEVVESIGEYVKELLRPDTIAHLRVAEVAEGLAELVATLILEETAEANKQISDLEDSIEEMDIRLAALETPDDLEETV